MFFGGHGEFLSSEREIYMRGIFLCCTVAVVVLCGSGPAYAQDPDVGELGGLGAGGQILGLDESSKNMLLGVTGLPQAKDLSFAKIGAYVLFGSIGFIAFAYGKKNENWRAMIIGIGLMGYAYFFSSTLMLYLFGSGLTAALYFWRE